jgi:hypothetical protein
MIYFLFVSHLIKLFQINIFCRGWMTNANIIMCESEKGVKDGSRELF